MKLIIFSDIHYGPEDRGWHKGLKRKLTQHAEALTKKLIGKINKIKPDGVVILGDLIEDVEDHKLDKINLKKIYSIIKTIKVPYYLLAGNHDLRTLSRVDFEEATELKKWTFSKDVNGYHLVFLGLSCNGKLSQNDGGILKTRELSKKDLDWLKSDLANNSLPALIFIHYGLAEDNMAGNWWFGKNPEHALLQNRKEVKEILEKSGKVLAVFSGHQHWTKTIVENGISYHVLGSLTEDFDFNGKPDGIWFMVDIDKDNLKITERHLS